MSRPVRQQREVEVTTLLVISAGSGEACFTTLGALVHTRILMQVTLMPTDLYPVLCISRLFFNASMDAFRREQLYIQTLDNYEYPVFEK